MIDGLAVWSGDGGARFAASAAEPVMAYERLRIVADLALTNTAELIGLAGGVLSVPAAIAELYRREGTAFLTRLRGGFALGIWDGRDERLLLAVDRVGIKRLYYADDASGTAFASCATAVRRAPGVTRAADAGAVWQYLNFGFVPAPHSGFAGIARLEPGAYRLRDAHRASGKTYWDLAYRERRMREADASRALMQVTEDAVRDALAGGPAASSGTFLSGGTDSSTVLGLAARITGERLTAFSIGFAEASYDELAYARIAARRFGAEHVTAVVDPDAALAAMPALVEACDEPFGNNSMIGTYLCARLARERGIARLLAGDGGDELFGGNERYRIDRIFAAYHRVPRLVRRVALEPILAALPGVSVVGRAQRYVRRANMPNPRRFFSYQFLFAPDADRVAGEALRGHVDVHAPWQVVDRHWQRADTTAELNRLLYLDMKLAIADNDLYKVTRSTDLAGIDVRFPLLDPHLIELASTLPARFKVRGLDKRWLFKRAFRSLLPPEILAKPKHGFGVPTSEWLRSHAGFRDLAHDALGSVRARQRGWLAPGVVDKLLRQHAEDTTAYYGDILWVVLMLELWQRRHVDEAA